MVTREKTSFARVLVGRLSNIGNLAKGLIIGFIEYLLPDLLDHGASSVNRLRALARLLGFVFGFLVFFCWGTLHAVPPREVTLSTGAVVTALGVAVVTTKMLSRQASRASRLGSFAELSVWIGGAVAVFNMTLERAPRWLATAPLLIIGIGLIIWIVFSPSVPILERFRKVLAVIAALSGFTVAVYFFIPPSNDNREAPSYVPALAGTAVLLMGIDKFVPELANRHKPLTRRLRAFAWLLAWITAGLAFLIVASGGTTPIGVVGLVLIILAAVYAGTAVVDRVSAASKRELPTAVQRRIGGHPTLDTALRYSLGRLERIARESNDASLRFKDAQNALAGRERDGIGMSASQLMELDHQELLLRYSELRDKYMNLLEETKTEHGAIASILGAEIDSLKQELKLAEEQSASSELIRDFFLLVFGLAFGIVLGPSR